MAQPAQAAVLVMTTRDGRVLVGKRSDSLGFLGGFLVFPGGRIDPEDHQNLDGLIPKNTEDGVFKLAAFRELAEETGVIVDGGRARSIPHALQGAPFPEIVKTMGASLPFHRLEFAGRWITPKYSPSRFDTHFFFIEVDDDCEVTADPSEFSWARFASATAILEDFEDFGILLSPPTMLALQVLQSGLSDAARRLSVLPRAQDEGLLAFEAVSGIRLLPLKSPTLPPATHTNSYVVGDQKLMVVDPASYEPEVRTKLLAYLEAHRAEGRVVDHILLTHHHPDHTGAAAWLSEKLQVPIAAHRETQAILRDTLKIDRSLEDGQTIDLGLDRRGRPFELKVIFTPGHAPGHIVLVDKREGSPAMIVGDMVAGIGTIIVDPPEGNMKNYLASLARLRELPQKVLFPAHGPPIVDGHQKLENYLRHRANRERQIWEALKERQQGTPRDLLPSAYSDTPKQLYPFAERACLAHLEKLEEDGAVFREGEVFRFIDKPPPWAKN